MDEYKFEEEETWRQARELAWDVYGVTSRGKFNSDQRMRNEIRRISFAIMADIAKGFERSGTAEFCRHLAKARDSIPMLQNLLSNAREKGYMHHEVFSRLEYSAEELGCMVGSIVFSLHQALIEVETERGIYQEAQIA